jgi:hypothetical protein
MRIPRTLVLSCTVLALVGAHHNRPHIRSTSTDGPPPEFLAGAGRSRWLPEQTFRLVPAESYGRLAGLDSAQQLTVYKLNRIDEKHARRRWLVVPDSVVDEMSYAPFPALLPALDSIPKVILVSERIQAFGAYENGRLIRWGPTSTGKRDTPTDRGLFFTTWKSRTAISTDDSTWVLNWYFNFISTKGIAFHEYDLPGRPASHGCVRLLEEDAQWIYQWADQWQLGRSTREPRIRGTPVLVVGTYDYSHRGPWLELPVDPTAGMVTAAEVKTELDSLLWNQPGGPAADALLLSLETAVPLN